MNALVVTQTRIFGPFKDANEAARWLTITHKNWSLSDGPFTIRTVEDPGEAAPWAAGWRDAEQSK